MIRRSLSSPEADWMLRHVNGSAPMRGVYGCTACFAGACILLAILISAAGPANAQEADLREYLLAAVNFEGEFLQNNLTSRRPPESLTYPRKVAPHGRVEGVFVNTDALPLSQYILASTTGSGRPTFAWPPGEGYRFFVELNPPVPELPSALGEGQTARTARIHAHLRAFDWRGRAFANGKATRIVRFKGYEDVRVQAGTFERCAKLEVETTFSFGWWCTARVREKLWVARNEGIVLREERISGHALLLTTFDSSFEYERLPRQNAPLAGEAQVAKGARLAQHAGFALSAQLAELPRWSRLAIYLDRGLPRPRIAGLAVEYAPAPQR